MNSNSDPISQAFVELALAIDRHLPGYIDAYFGPAELREIEEARPIRPLRELARQAEELAGAIARSESLDNQRRNFLSFQMRAMQTSLQILLGERLPLVEEVERLYDVTPAWVDENVFHEAQRTLDELLPPGDTLLERMQMRKKKAEVPYSRLGEILVFISERLRNLARQRFSLPAQESFEIQLVKDKPWYAYNWYLGKYKSRIEINTDIPQLITDMTFTLAHEGYPGHHSESSIKEELLVKGEGRLEHCLMLIHSPSSLISEGIGNQGLRILMTAEEQVQWHAEELFPWAGFSHLDARNEQQINLSIRKLNGASGNAAFLIHEEGASEAEAMAYLQQYALMNETEARVGVEFTSNPVFRSYIFNYTLGTQLLDELFAVKGEPIPWFGRLLNEPVTPSLVREWISG